jgi:hypothetical protein
LEPLQVTLCAVHRENAMIPMYEWRQALQTKSEEIFVLTVSTSSCLLVHHASLISMNIAMKIQFESRMLRACYEIVFREVQLEKLPEARQEFHSREFKACLLISLSLR